MIQRGANEAFREEQLKEIESIKEVLSRHNYSENVAMITKAVMMPPLLEWNPTARKYPSI